MTLGAFVDESYRGTSYLLCAVMIDGRHIAQARRAMASMLHGGQGRIHMAKENDRRRRALLTQISRLDVAAQLIAVRVRGRSVRSSRDLAFQSLTAQLVESGTTHLSIESCDQDKQDRQVIGDALAKAGRTGALDVRHLRPHDEPLLWIPDAIAWAYGKGGKEWLGLVQPMITRVTDL